MKIQTFCMLLLVSLLLAPHPESRAEDAAQVIHVVRVADVISPVQAEFVVAELARANALPARAFLLELDTPGGLDTAMRSMIQAILASQLPVIVYVSPAGARAASAGALITLAADFAVMAPGTNIGAAHPVAIGPGAIPAGQEEVMMGKVVNDAVAYARSLAEKRGRNVEWAERIVRESISTQASEALELKVIDLIAENRQQLLTELDGRHYLREGRVLVLQTRGVTLVELEMNWRQQILASLSNPNVAYLLLMLGMLGIFFEISQPGVILPGAVGAIALLLALFAFQTLPVNYIGVLLMLLAIVLFILEIKVVSYGMLTIGGMVAMTLGSLMLVDSPEPYLQISRPIIAATVLVSSGCFVLVLYFVVRTQKTRFVSGVEGMIGESGRAVTEINPDGRVFVHGEYWDARSAEPIARDAAVKVVRVDRHLRLEVAAADEPGSGYGVKPTDEEDS
jgi:membrane-bound serine protease (ClpP class)